MCIKFALKLIRIPGRRQEGDGGGDVKYSTAAQSAREFVSQSRVNGVELSDERCENAELRIIRASPICIFHFIMVTGNNWISISHTLEG